jgi:type I phosphodiesterase/nucleotide pyrophosphatase
VADSSPPKIVMIGMDAAELSFIGSQLSSLPVLQEILRTGTLHRLGSTAGVFPGSVWPTFYSGVLPGEHGIYHHLQWDADTMHLRRVTQDWLYVEPFWYELERRGLHVAAIDVPMSFPSRLSRGVEIINWGSHDELGPFGAYPKHLRSEIRHRFGGHPMGSEIPVRKSSGQLEKIRRNLIAGAKRKSALSRWILAQADWDLFLTVFGETHRGGHLLWPEEPSEDRSQQNGLLEVYRAVDRSIGELLEALPESVTTIILFALHGMGPNNSQDHFMPKVIDRLNARFLGNGGMADNKGDRQSAGSQRSLMRTLRENLPAELQNAIARAVSVTVRDLVVSRQISAGHDWVHTPGIALLADLNGYLRWNILGRERRGMLEADGRTFDRYGAWIRQCLMGLKASSGGAGVVREVLLSRDHFPGRRSAQLPDAVVTWNGLPPLARIYSEALGEIASEPGTGRSGNHKAEGFCLIVDRSVPRGRTAPPPQHISELASFVSALLLS